MNLNKDYSHVSNPTKIIRGNFQTWVGCIFYLIPLALAIIILYLNFSRLYWFPLSGISLNQQGLRLSANNVINILYVVAKAYELLVATSLGFIALAVFKRCLVHDGIPFGLLTGAYRISDIQYIASKRFWSAARSNLKIAILLLVCVVLCTLIGPASSILIVPKLGWFDLPTAFSNIYMPMYLREHRILWPSTLNESLFNGWEFCLGRPGNYDDNCPASGFAHLYSWIEGWEVSELSPNITFEDPSISTSRKLHMVSTGSSKDSPGTILTSLTSLTTRSIGKLQAYFTENDVGDIHSTETYKLQLDASSINYQPLVNAKCNTWTRKANTTVSKVPEAYYPSTELNCYSDDNKDECHRMREYAKTIRVPERYWSFDQRKYRFDAHQDENDPHNTTSVATFVSALPYLQRDQPRMRIFACTYVAYWIPSTPILEPSTYRSIESNITDLNVFANKTSFKADKKANVGPVMRIKPSWLRYVDLSKSKSDEEGGNNGGATNSIFYLLRAMMYKRNGTWYFGPGASLPESEADNMARITMEKVTGAIVTDAIARTASMENPYITRPIEGDPKGILAVNLGSRKGAAKKEYEFFSNRTVRIFDEWKPGSRYSGLSPEKALAEWSENRTSINFDVQRFGYGYGNPGIALIFAIVVNIICMIFVLAYCLGTIYFQADTIVAFGDVQDLISLAWNSPAASEMEHQVLQVTDKKLWSKSVVVGATSSRTVEMDLVENRKDSKLLTLAKEEEYY